MQLLGVKRFSLCVRPKDSSCCLQVLQQVQAVPLLILKILLSADELSLDMQGLLAECVSCKQLELCFRDPIQRLTAAPPGVRVVCSSVS